MFNRRHLFTNYSNQYTRKIINSVESFQKAQTDEFDRREV